MDICKRAGVDVNKAYFYTFANGVSCYSVQSNQNVTEDKFSEIRKTCNLIFTMPERSFIDEYLKSGALNP